MDERGRGLPALLSSVRPTGSLSSADSEAAAVFTGEDSLVVAAAEDSLIIGELSCDFTELVVQALSAKTKATLADSGAAKRRGVNICILFSTVNNNAPQHHFSEYAAVWDVQHL